MLARISRPAEMILNFVPFVCFVVKTYRLSSLVRRWKNHH